MNGKPGKLAIVLSSSIIKSPNIGKIILLERIATKEEVIACMYLGDDFVWKVDRMMMWRNLSSGHRFECQFMLDSHIKILPDLDEQEFIEESSLLLRKESV
jgi:hypothetical protein